jgi:hypothetical protein
MNRTITATFGISEPITLVATTAEQEEEIVEMLFANGALAISVRPDGVV